MKHSATPLETHINEISKDISDLKAQARNLEAKAAILESKLELLTEGVFGNLPNEEDWKEESEAFTVGDEVYYKSTKKVPAGRGFIIGRTSGSQPFWRIVSSENGQEVTRKSPQLTRLYQSKKQACVQSDSFESEFPTETETGNTKARYITK